MIGGTGAPVPNLQGRFFKLNFRDDTAVVLPQNEREMVKRDALHRSIQGR